MMEENWKSRLAGSCEETLSTVVLDFKQFVNKSLVKLAFGYCSQCSDKKEKEIKQQTK